MTLSAANAQAAKQSNQNFGDSASVCPYKPDVIEIVPIRYAIDESTEQTINPNPLPSDWKGKPALGSALITNAYTLRQIRDGWLYVWNSRSKELAEYEINGAMFAKQELSKEDVNLGIKQQAPFISYHKDAVLYIGYAEIQLTSRLKALYSDNRNYRKKFMRRLDLSSVKLGMIPEHTAPIKHLAEYVADIDGAGGQSEFKGHLCPTVESDNSDFFKPRVAEIEYLKGINCIDSAIMVALDDLIADVVNLTSYLGVHVATKRAFDEDKGYQLAYMHAIMNLTNTKADANFQYPDSVKTPDEKRTFYTDLSYFFESNNDFETASKMSGDYNGIKSARVDAADTLRDKRAAEFRKKYRCSPFNHASYPQWVATKKWRDEVNWKKIQGESAQLEEELAPLMDNLANAAQTLQKAVMLVGNTAPEKMLLDVACMEGQKRLIQVTKYAIEIITQEMDETISQWLAKQFDDPDCFLPLILSGFSETLYRSFGDKLPTENALFSFNDTGALLGRVNDFLGMIGHEQVRESKWFKFLKLAEFEQSVLTAYNDAVTALGNKTTSILAKPILATLSVTMHSKNAALLRWRLIVAEYLALKTPFQLTQMYEEKIKQWANSYHSAVSELAKTNRALASLKTSPLDQATRDLYARKSALMTKIEEHQSTNHYGHYQEQQRLRRELADMEREFDRLPVADEFESKAIHYQKEIGRLKLELEDLQTYYYSPVMLKDAELEQVVRQAVKASINGNTEQAKNLYSKLGGLGTIVFLFNVQALYSALATYNSNPERTFRESYLVVQHSTNVAAGIAGMFAGAAYSRLSDDKNLGRSIQRLLVNESDDIRKQAAKFYRFTVAGSVFAVITGAIEVFDSIDEYQDALTTEERALIATKGLMSAAATIAAIAVIRNVAASRFGSLILSSVLTGPLAVVAFLGGLLSMLVSLRLNAIKKDEFQQWLCRSPWGESPTPEWSVANSNAKKGVTAALEALQDLTLAPAVYHQLRVKQIPSMKTYSGVTVKRVDGVELEIGFPASLKGDNIELSIQNTGPGAAVKLPFGQWTLGSALGLTQGDSGKPKNLWIYKLVLPKIPDNSPIKLAIRYPLHLDKTSSLVGDKGYCFSIFGSQTGLIAKPLTKAEEARFKLSSAITTPLIIGG